MALLGMKGKNNMFMYYNSVNSNVNNKVNLRSENSNIFSGATFGRFLPDLQKSFTVVYLVKMGLV
jgi:hypothetical protein